MEIIGIILARGGSKRIPHKNIIPLAGQPLITYTIEDALQSKLITRVIVSTDDAEIATVAKKYQRVEVMMRPAQLSGDTVTSEDVIAHILAQLEKTEKYSPDLIVLLQCTSPLRKDEDIDNSIRTLCDQGADSLFSVVRFTKYVWQVKNKEVSSLNFDYKSQFWREQDFPPQYQANGSIFIFKPWLLKELKNRYGGKIALYEMDYLDSFQIDTKEDLMLCECILKQKKEK